MLLEDRRWANFFVFKNGEKVGDANVNRNFNSHSPLRPSNGRYVNSQREKR